MQLHDFPVDPAFACTVYKAQGRTLDSIVIAVHDRGAQCLQMRYATLYAALSRVGQTCMSAVKPVDSQNIQGLMLIILNEVSTVSATAAMIATLDERLKRATGDFDTPYGGICVLLVGDFSGVTSNLLSIALVLL
jgi:hypothetical protein